MNSKNLRMKLLNENKEISYTSSGLLQSPPYPEAVKQGVRVIKTIPKKITQLFQVNSTY